MLPKLRPSEIRFIQDDISNVFQTGVSVNETAENVCDGNISVNDFPAIKVVKFGNKYFSFDNRRLYVFRVAEYRGHISHVRVQIVDQSRFDKNRYTTKNDGRSVTVRRGITLQHCKSGWLCEQSGYNDRPTAVTMYTNTARPSFLSDIPTPTEKPREARIPIEDEDDFMDRRPSRVCPCAIM